MFPKIQVEFWPLGIPPLLSKKLWQLLAFDHGWKGRGPWWRLGAFLRFPWISPRSPLSVGSSRSALSAFSGPLGSVNWRGSSLGSRGHQSEPASNHSGLLGYCGDVIDVTSRILAVITYMETDALSVRLDISNDGQDA